MQQGWSWRVWCLGCALLMAVAAGCASSDDEATGAEDTVAAEVVADADVVADAEVPDSDVVADVDSVEVDTEVDLPPQPAGPYEVPSGPEDGTFWAGPWLGETTTTSVAVSWQTVAAGSSMVEFGLDASYGEIAEGEGSGTMHEVQVTGLLPETLYHYRACSDDTCSGDLTFATAPALGRPFRFAVYGDTQTDFAVHAQVSESIRESLPALVLLAGDIVGYGADRLSYVIEYFEPARRRSHYIPTYVVPGNHDWKEPVQQLKNLRDYFALPKDPDVPLEEASYSFSYGDAFFIALDNTIDGGHIFFPMGGAKTPPLWDWLEAQAASEAAQAARWRFAFFHYPPQSECQEQWMNMQATLDIVLPLLQDHGFQAVFTGHTHDYQHHHIDQIHAFITGGGGGGLDTDEDCTNGLPELVYRQSIHHHLTVDLGDEQAIVRAVAIDGEEIDRVILDREPAPATN